ncbi:MAG: hypothetical protein WA664_00480, partial [Candidatus Acidiferrales bacterium]
RTWPERQLRASKGEPPCTNPYMRRERVEANLNLIFAERLTDRDFLERTAAELYERTNSAGSKSELSKLQKMNKRLQETRERVLDAYFSTVISRAERDRRLDRITADQQFCDQQLRNVQTQAVGVSAEDLAHVLAPLKEWEYLSRNDKRRVLQAIVPEIHLQHYNVTKLAVLVQDPYRHELNHTDMDSSPPPA